MKDFPKPGLAGKLMEMAVSAISEAVDALEAEMTLVKAWAADQAKALAAARMGADEANAARDHAVADLVVAKAQIDELAAKLASATPGTAETDALVAELQSVTARLADLHAAPVPPVDIPPPPDVAPSDTPAEPV